MADRRPLVVQSSGLVSELPAGDRIAGLRLGIEVQAWDADLDALAALTTPATTLTGAAQKAANLSDLANAGIARSNLGLVIGTNVQAWDADLDALAALTTPATTLTGAAQKSANLSDLANAGTARTNLGLGIGVNVQAYSANLDAFALKTAPTGAVVGTTDSQALTNKTFVAGSNTLSGITTSMFAANVVDTDSTLAANSATRLVAQSAVKSYVDNLITGLKWKAAVRVATTVAGTLTTSFAAGQVVDGATLVLADRILIKNQATGSENGIRVVTAGTPTRALDADAAAEIAGCTVMVEEGTVNGDTQWTCTNNENVVLGTDAITFVQIAGAGTYSAGFGLTLTGNQFAITDPELVALAGLTSAADKLGYFTGSGTAALADLTSVARTLIAQTTQALMRTTGLGLGTSATVNTGTSGATIPLLNAANTWALAQTLTTAPVFGDQSGTRSALGLVIGTNVQAWDADLDAIAALTAPATSITGAAQKASNLSDLANAGTARGNLGLGTAAVEAVGTSGHTLPFLDGANTFSALQNFTTAATTTAVIQAICTDPGATQGPLVDLYRNSASPAASDTLGHLRFTGNTSTAVLVAYATIFGTILDPTNGAENGRLSLAARVAGSNAVRLSIESGAYMAGATGSDKGSGTFNATALYEQGAAISAKYLQAANNLSDVANAVTARSSLGLVIGTNVQAWDADLDAVAALTSPATSITGAGQKSTINTWALAQTFTTAPVFTDQAGSRTALGLGLVTINGPWVNLASGTTTDLGAQSSSYLNITGTTTISSFGLTTAGTLRYLKFAGSLILAYGSTTIIIPGSASITTAAGDIAVVISEGSVGPDPVWRVLDYIKANGKSVIGPATADITDSTSIGRSLVTAATQGAGQSALGLGTAAVEASGTSGHAFGFLDGVNTWSAAQTWTANPTLSATTAGVNTVAPTLTLFRNVAIAGSTSQNLGVISFTGQDSGGTTTNYSRIFASIDDSTDTAETGRVIFQTMQAGTLGSRVSIGLGLYTLNRSDQGLNTINATTLYEADVSLATKYGALASANNWSASNTFTSSTTTFVSTAAASGSSSPVVAAYRNSATVAAGNAIGMFGSYGNNSLLAQTRYSAYATIIDDPTATAETAHILLQTVQAGAQGNRVIIGLGLYTGSRSDQGSNTINATTLYESDVSLATKYAPLAGDATFTSSLASSLTAHPVHTLYRNGGNSVATHLMGQLQFAGGSSTGVQRTWGQMTAKVITATNAAEDGEIDFDTIQAGAVTSALKLGKGLYTPSQTDQGLNTIAAATFYEGGTTLAGTYASLDLYRRLTADATGSNGATAQPWFPTTGGVTLLATTLYEFEGQLILNRTAGTTSHTISILFGGTATLTDIGYVATVGPGATNVLATLQSLQSAAATAIVLTAANTSATEFVTIVVKGMVSVNGGGTFIPQFKYSTAPGGAPTVLKNSFFKLTKLGVNTSDHFGTWA